MLVRSNRAVYFMEGGQQMHGVDMCLSCADPERGGGGGLDPPEKSQKI